jgi:antitoxin ParD1/3/4
MLIAKVITMAMVKKSITVTEQQDNWIRTQIETGHYGNESEVVRELIRERQLREQTSSQAIEAIRAKLIETENSGFTDQTPAEILKEIKDGLGRDAL